MILMDQEQPGGFFCRIKHTLRKAAFAEHSEDNVIPGKCPADFSSTVNLLLQRKIHRRIHRLCMVFTFSRKYPLCRGVDQSAKKFISAEQKSV